MGIRACFLAYFSFMLQFLPKSDYPEDQQNAKIILQLHGVAKGLQTGSLVGFATGTVYGLIRKQPVLATAAKASGIGMLAFSALVPGLILIQMQGKQDIEWKDRSWRLQRHQGQLNVDTLSTTTMLTGGLLGPTMGYTRIGGAGIGAGLGVIAHVLLSQLQKL
jgi:hypothetical protein